MTVMEAITKRLYLMAHAPAEPQSWFTPVMPTPYPAPPPRPAHEDPMTVAEAHEYAAWQSGMLDPADMTQKRIASCVGQLLEQRRLAALWRQEQDKQRYIQWPAAWADEIIKAEWSGVRREQRQEAQAPRVGISDGFRWDEVLDARAPV